MNTPVYADNCQACGKEHLSIELIPVKLGTYSASRIRVCLKCLIKSDVYGDYKEAAELIMSTSMIKNSQEISKEAASQAKNALKNVLGQPNWLRGIGIGGAHNRYCIKVNVASLTDEVQNAIPESVSGVPVVVEVVGDILAQDV